MQMFDWKANCMFCDKTCQKYVKHPDRNNCHEVTTLSFKDQILNASEKQSDKVSEEVALRVGSCNDLVAVEARYHTSCRITCKSGKKHFIMEKINPREFLVDQLKTRNRIIWSSYVSGWNKKPSVWSKNYMKKRYN